MYKVKFNMCFQYIIPGTMLLGASAVELTYNFPTTSDFCTGIPGMSCLVQILPLTQCTA